MGEAYVYPEDTGDDTINPGASGVGQKVETLYFSGAVAAGDAVEMDLSDSTHGLGKSYKKMAASSTGAFEGIAMETLTAAGYARVLVEGIYDDANVATSETAGWAEISGTAGRLQGETSPVQKWFVTGAAAGDVTVTGILTTDVLEEVLNEDNASGVLVDLTGEFTITAADTINNTGGTATTGDPVLVTAYRSRDRRRVYILETAADNKARVRVFPRS